MSEIRICKSCGKPIHHSEYKQYEGRCYQCQPGYGGKTTDPKITLQQIATALNLIPAGHVGTSFILGCSFYKFPNMPQDKEMYLTDYKITADETKEDPDLRKQDMVYLWMTERTPPKNLKRVRTAYLTTSVELEDFVGILNHILEDWKLPPIKL